MDSLQLHYKTVRMSNVDFFSKVSKINSVFLQQDGSFQQDKQKIPFLNISVTQSIPNVYAWTFWKVFTSFSLGLYSQTNVRTCLFYLIVVFIIALYAEGNMGYIGCII